MKQHTRALLAAALGLGALLNVRSADLTPIIASGEWRMGSGPRTSVYRFDADHTWRELWNGEVKTGEWKQTGDDTFSIAGGGRYTFQVLPGGTEIIRLPDKKRTWVLHTPATTVFPEPAAAQAGNLFNGKNLDGWLATLKPNGAESAPTWRVSNGVLACTGSPAGYLYTVKTYANYKLTLEWRWTGPAPVGKDGKPRPRNNGVLLHMQGNAESARLGVWPKSLEAQLAEGQAGDFWVIGGVETDQWRALREKTLAAASSEKERKSALSLRRVPKTGPAAEKPIGQWNTYEIVCRGDTVVTTVNGVEQNRATGLNVSEGHICLQSEGSAIEFRNINLTPLAD
ncbi:MAG: DUF1080 domain-containing protein [Opitutaceae bacterium]|jgi:hypothetical protein|nr:DUF1080 domain-containing protein [Opitutaceae bacterium]